MCFCSRLIQLNADTPKRLLHFTLLSLVGGNVPSDHPFVQISFENWGNSPFYVSHTLIFRNPKCMTVANQLGRSGSLPTDLGQPLASSMACKPRIMGSASRSRSRFSKVLGMQGMQCNHFPLRNGIYIAPSSLKANHHSTTLGK